MFKKFTAALLALILAFSAASCTANTTEDTDSAQSVVSEPSTDTSTEDSGTDTDTQTNTDTDTSASTVSDSEDDTSSVESTAGTDGTDTSDDTSYMPDVALGDDEVTITLPSYYYDDASSAVAEAQNEEGVESVTINEDGSITYVYTREYYDNMMAETRSAIDESFQELLISEEYPTIVSVDYDKDTLSDVVVTVTSQEEFESSTEDSYAIYAIEFTLVVYAMLLPDDSTVVLHIVDSSGNEFQTDDLKTLS